MADAVIEGKEGQQGMEAALANEDEDIEEEDRPKSDEAEDVEDDM